MTACVDWHRVIWDLVQRDMSLREISERIGVARAALYGYLEGSHPAHWKGDLLRALWCKVTGRPESEVPLTEVAQMPRHEFLRSSVLKAEKVADSLSQLNFAWFAPAEEVERKRAVDATPVSVRFRIGVARTAWADRALSAFVVYDQREEKLAEGAREFVRWCGEWQEVDAGILATA